MRKRVSIICDVEDDARLYFEWLEMQLNSGEHTEVFRVVDVVEGVASDVSYRKALEDLVIQIERSNAFDDHGHPLRMLKALHDAQRLLGRPVTDKLPCGGCGSVPRMPEAGKEWG